MNSYRCVLTASLALAVTSVTATALTQADGAAPQPATVALVVAWPDGGAHYELTSTRRAVFWTPQFRRVNNFKPAEGSTPVYAVQFARLLVGHDIRVDVSVLLGSAQPPGVPVAFVLVPPGAKIVVKELTKFGVQPVTLSMVEVRPTSPYLPTVSSASAQIEIARVDLLTAPYPGYRVTLRNLSSKGVSNVHVQSYSGQNKALSALKRTDDGRPMMMPGSLYSFDINLVTGPATDSATWSPSPLDLIELDSIRWDDGTYDGVPPFPLVDAAIEADSGRRLQLRRVLEQFQLATAPDLLRARIESLPDAEPDQLPAAQRAMRDIKAAVLNDLMRFRERSPQDTREWLNTIRRRYEAWLQRLSPP